MDFYKFALVVGAALMLVACGGERTTPFNVVRSSSSSAINSSLLSSASSSASSTKVLKLNFDDAGCVVDHNADATTEFDAFGEKRKMFAWSCVQDPSGITTTKGMNLTYAYDQVVGCYKKDLKKDDLLHGGLTTEADPDCTQPASSILKPAYAVEIISFDVTTERHIVSSINVVKFSFDFVWKNAGDLPLSQISVGVTVESADGGLQGIATDSASLGHQIYIFPGDLFKSTDPNYGGDWSFDSLRVGQSYNVSLTIKDYYGAILASATKQISDH